MSAWTRFAAAISGPGKMLIAYEVDEESDELVINILGVFHGGQDWEAALREDKVTQRPAEEVSVRGKCVAGESNGGRSWSTLLNVFPQVRGTLPPTTVNGR